jgi:putative hydrolase of the HAD superfamily
VPEDAVVPGKVPVRGVITDWGGVLTNPIGESVNAWLAEEAIDREHYASVMRPLIAQAYRDGADDNLIHALERGECREDEFERLLASQLRRIDGGQVAAAGLLTRMFAASRLEVAMVELIRQLRAAGLRTALLSNSWGRSSYHRPLFAELFDEVVISCEVGMRKPEERIFQLATSRLGLSPAECVFIDDIEANVLAAEGAGLIGLWHTEVPATAAMLTELLGMQLKTASQQSQ